MPTSHTSERKIDSLNAYVSNMVLGNVIILYNPNPVKRVLSSYFIGENRLTAINHLAQYLTALCNKAWKSNSKAHALSHHDTALKSTLFTYHPSKQGHIKGNRHGWL